MSAIVVRPVRYSADIPAMVRFLQALGLREVSRQGDGVDLAGQSGVVALRPVPPGVPAGTTVISAEVEDLGAFVDRLRTAGVQVDVEGDAAGVTDPRGTRLLVEGVPSTGSVTPHGDMHVMPMVFVEDHTDDKGFFEAWGLEVLGVERPGFVAMGASGAGGQIAVHLPVPGRQPVPELPGATQLAAATTTPLEVVARRLAEAGYPDSTMHHTPRGDRLGITDPDGQVVKIHPR